VWRCFVRDQARVPSVAGAVAPFFVTATVFFLWIVGTRARPQHGAQAPAFAWTVDATAPPRLSRGWQRTFRCARLVHGAPTDIPSTMTMSTNPLFRHPPPPHTHTHRTTLPPQPALRPQRLDLLGQRLALLVAVAQLT